MIGLQLNRTNRDFRATLASGWQQDALHGEGLLHLEKGLPVFGGNLSYAAGQRWLLHLESSLAFRRSLLAESAAQPAADAGKRWRLQTAAGGTFTSAGNIATTFELHFNQAGMSADDWSRWFDRLAATGGEPAQTGRLWSVRRLARDQQEPLSRWQLFGRLSWADAVVDDLTLNLLAIGNLADRSFMTQFESIYAFSDTLVLTARLIRNFGDARSEYGSQPDRMTTLCRLEYFF